MRAYWHLVTATLVVAVLGVLVVGCGADDYMDDGPTQTTGSGTEVTPPAEPDEGGLDADAQRARLADALGRAGATDAAELVRDPDALVVARETGFLDVWRLVDVDRPTGPGVTVAYDGREAFVVRSEVDFDRMVAADPAPIADAGSAEELVRARLPFTGGPQAPTYVIDGVDDIVVGPVEEAPDPERLAATLQELRAEVRPPVTSREADGIRVTVVVVAGDVVERRVFLVADDGSVHDAGVERLGDGLQGPVFLD